MPEIAADRHSGYFVRAVGNAIDILEILSERREPVSLVRLTELLGRSKSSVFRILCTLEEKGLLERKVIPTNRRQRSLTITAEGERLLEELIPGSQRLRRRILAPLTGPEQLQFMELLSKLVQENNEQSRAPLAPRDTVR